MIAFVQSNVKKLKETLTTLATMIQFINNLQDLGERYTICGFGNL